MKKILTIAGIIIVILVTVFTWWQNRTTFSIIVPVYNAEKYIERCLDSIFSQKGNFEVIAVNDGSTDSSAEILQKYNKKYSNLKVINQENKGVSAARNTGIAQAKNKYITFVDADDWLEPDAFERVEKVLKEDKPDILLTGFYDVYDREWVRNVKGEEYINEVAEENRYPDRSLDKLALFSPFYGKEAYSDLFYAGGGVRGRFYRKDFVINTGINFPEGAVYGEDDVFIYRLILHNPLISILTKPVYNYRNRADSLAKTKDVIKENRKTLERLRQSTEYQSARRHVQMLINDTWLSWTILGIANLYRHGALNEAGMEEASAAYQSLLIYNSAELQACRNFIKLGNILQKRGLNPPL